MSDRFVVGCTYGYFRGFVKTTQLGGFKPKFTGDVFEAALYKDAQEAANLVEMNQRMFPDGDVYRFTPHLRRA